MYKQTFITFFNRFSISSEFYFLEFIIDDVVFIITCSIDYMYLFSTLT